MTAQLLLGSGSSPRLQSVRTIHYLGSKRRAVDSIVRSVAELARPGDRVCDLFAGSGVVADALAHRWSVTAVDVQEYSRVLCSALLAPVSHARERAVALVGRAQRDPRTEAVRAALGDLFAEERKALGSASVGDGTALAELLELAPLATFSHDGGRPSTVCSAVMERLRQSGLADALDTVTTRYYGGVYFSWQQAFELDALLSQVHSLCDPDRDYFLAAVLVTASEVVNTVGKQFAQPVKLLTKAGHIKSHLLGKAVRDRSLSVYGTFQSVAERLSQGDGRPGLRHRSLRMDYRDALRDQELSFDAVYADPPYTRDHYSRYYHVLETMALRDDPGVSSTKIHNQGRHAASRGVYREDRHQSPFCIKSQAPAAFAQMFDLIVSRGVPLVLSYSPYPESGRNRPRVLTMEQLLELAHLFFRGVDILPVAGIVHNKLNAADLNVPAEHLAEVLVVCKP